jgi:hypothetical protein
MRRWFSGADMDLHDSRSRLGYLHVPSAFRDGYVRLGDGAGPIARIQDETCRLEPIQSVRADSVTDVSD